MENKIVSHSKNTPSKGLTLSQDKSGREELACLLVQCFRVLNTYGRQADFIKDIVPMFIMVLEGSTISQVRDAFKRYMQQNSAMPTPADIYKLIPRDRDDLLDYKETEYYQKGGK